MTGQAEQAAHDAQMRRMLLRLLHDRVEAGKRNPRPFVEGGDEDVARELRRILRGAVGPSPLGVNIIGWAVVGSVALVIVVGMLRLAVWMGQGILW